jgi:tetratricopeptide (TPR) repeat protein
LDPRDASIRGNLARVRTVVGHRLTQAGRLSEAEIQYRAALDADPGEVAAWVGLGELQLRQRDPREAVEAFRRAVELKPEDGETRVRLGQAYYNVGDLPAALSEWERAAATRSDDGALREQIARVRREADIQSSYRAKESQHFAVVYEGQRQEDLGQEFVRLLEHAYLEVGYSWSVSERCSSGRSCPMSIRARDRSLDGGGRFCGSLTEDPDCPAA